MREGGRIRLLQVQTNRQQKKKPLARLFFSAENETKRKVTLAGYYTSKYDGGHFGSTQCHVTGGPAGGRCEVF